MTLTVYLKGQKLEDGDKISQMEFGNSSDIDIEYEGFFEKEVEKLGSSHFSLPLGIVNTSQNIVSNSPQPSESGLLSRLLWNSLFTIVDDDDEAITYISESGFTTEVKFTDPEEEEEDEEDEDEDEDKDEKEEEVNAPMFPVQDDSHAPEILNPKKEETRHVPISKW